MVQLNLILSTRVNKITIPSLIIYIAVINRFLLKAAFKWLPSLMPNPVADAFTIRFQSPIPPNYQVMLLSANGRLVFNSNYSVNPRRSQNG